MAADVNVRRRSVASFASEMAGIFKGSIKTISDTCARNNQGIRWRCSGYRAAGNVWEIQVPDGGYILMIQYGNLEIRFIKEHVGYEKRLQKVL